MYNTVDTGVSSLGFLAPLIKYFKNRHKLKLEGNLLELKGKASRQASCKSHSCQGGRRREQTRSKSSDKEIKQQGRHPLRQTATMQ